jgi:hypothetical protein
MSREQLLRAPGCRELEAHLQEMLALPLGQLSQLREGKAFEDAATASPNAAVSMSSFFLIATTFQGVLGKSPLILTVRGGTETGQRGSPMGEPAQASGA